MDNNVAVPRDIDGSEFAAGPRSRQKKYEHRVAEAIRQGKYGKMIWAELARDYNAAIANVLTLWHQVDSHFSKGPRPLH